MHCPEASELMSLQLDDLLVEEQAKVLEQHVRDCEPCAELWQQMQSAALLFADMERVLPPANLTDNVMVAVRRKEARARYLRRGIVLSVGLLLVSALALIPLLAVAVSAINNPELARAGLGLVLRIVEVLGVLAGAVRGILLATLGGPNCLIPVGYVLFAGLLVALWARVVTRPVRIIAR